MPIFVNDVEITDDAVHREMQYHPASHVEEAQHKAAQALVVQELLRQAARKAGLLQDDTPTAEDTAIDLLLQQEISLPDADSESCHRYYMQNQVRFTDKKTGEILPFSLVESRICDYMRARSLRTGISQYIRVLAGQARIAGFDMEAADSPLVQ
ncbi:MAG: hypothetical protein IT567_07565 [Alphaproteobacteria bacterium]|nr:hypothetical protein [Alphaproteobacteria bacterium]